MELHLSCTKPSIVIVIVDYHCQKNAASAGKQESDFESKPREWQTQNIIQFLKGNVTHTLVLIIIYLNL